jgi:hypothetical protein
MEEKQKKGPNISPRAKEINEALTAAKAAEPDITIVQPAILTRVKTPAELEKEAQQASEAKKYQP